MTIEQIISLFNAGGMLSIVAVLGLFYMLVNVLFTKRTDCESCQKRCRAELEEKLGQIEKDYVTLNLFKIYDEKVSKLEESYSKSYDKIEQKIDKLFELIMEMKEKK